MTCYKTLSKRAGLVQPVIVQGESLGSNVKDPDISSTSRGIKGEGMHSESYCKCKAIFSGYYFFRFQKMRLLPVTPQN